MAMRPAPPRPPAAAPNRMYLGWSRPKVKVPNPRRWIFNEGGRWLTLSWVPAYTGGRILRLWLGARILRRFRCLSLTLTISGRL